MSNGLFYGDSYFDISNGLLKYKDPVNLLSVRYSFFLRSAILQTEKRAQGKRLVILLFLWYTLYNLADRSISSARLRVESYPTL